MGPDSVLVATLGRVQGFIGAAQQSVDGQHVVAIVSRATVMPLLDLRLVCRGAGHDVSQGGQLDTHYGMCLALLFGPLELARRHDRDEALRDGAARDTSRGAFR